MIGTKEAQLNEKKSSEKNIRNKRNTTIETKQQVTEIGKITGNKKEKNKTIKTHKNQLLAPKKKVCILEVRSCIGEALCH